MSSAKELIESLALSPHPEGGFYREVYRSFEKVKPRDERGERSAATVIYYLLEGNQSSRWHNVRSDEIWQHVAGVPLELFISPDLKKIEHRTIASNLENVSPLQIVPANCWQAAKPQGGFALVTCTVAPGFAFEDFRFLSPEERKTLASNFSEFPELL